MASEHYVRNYSSNSYLRDEENYIPDKLINLPAGQEWELYNLTHISCSYNIGFMDNNCWLPFGHLSCAKHCSKPLTLINSFNHHNNKEGDIFSIEKSLSVDQRYQLVSGRKRTWTQRVCLQFLFLAMTVFWQKVKEMTYIV